MHQANLAIIRAFGSQMEADIAQSALEPSRIDSTIQADSAGGMRPHLAWASGGFKLLVREEDEPDARETLSVFEEPIQP